MKIIEALKRVKLNRKKITDNSELIQKYSSGVSNERPYFDSEDNQRKEISRLEQSSLDLLRDTSKLEIAIILTNVLTKIRVQGKIYSLFELLKWKRIDGNILEIMYHSMNDQSGNTKMRYAQQSAGGDPVQLIRYYSESYKQTKLRETHDLVAEADSLLEVINATTDLIEVDSALALFYDYLTPSSGPQSEIK